QPKKRPPKRPLKNPRPKRNNTHPITTSPRPPHHTADEGIPFVSMHFTPRHYTTLERAIDDRLRISLYRRGTEYVLLPQHLALRNGKEYLDTVQPSTGDRMSIPLDDIDAFEIIA